jgi:hypothetical protein
MTLRLCAFAPLRDPGPEGAPIDTGTDALYELTMAVARGELSMRGLADALRALGSPDGKP